MLSSFKQIINVGAPSKDGLLQSFSNGGVAKLGLLIKGDGLKLDYRFVTGPGAGRPWDDVDLDAVVAANGLRVAIGAYDETNVAFCNTFEPVAIPPIAVTTSITGADGANAVQVVTIGEGAYDGGYSLTVTLPNLVTDDGSGTTTSGFTFLVTAKAENIEALLLTHPEANKDGKNGLRVTGNPGGPFSIEFINHLGLQPIADVVGADVNLVLPKRYTGRLSLNTDELRAKFLSVGGDVLTLRYEIEIQFPGEEPETVLELPIKLSKEIIVAGNPVPVGLSPQRGRTAVGNGVSFVDVAFGTAFAGAPILAGTPCVEKGSGADPDLFCTGISGLTAAGFRAHLSADTTNANYHLHSLAYIS